MRAPTSATRPLPPPLPNPCWCTLGDNPHEATGSIEDCPVHGEHPWPPRSPDDGWKCYTYHWVYPSHDKGMPAGEPDGPFLNLDEAIDALLPGGMVVQSVAYSGVWLGQKAQWPVLPAEGDAG